MEMIYGADIAYSDVGCGGVYDPEIAGCRPNFDVCKIKVCNHAGNCTCYQGSSYTRN